MIPAEVMKNLKAHMKDILSCFFARILHFLKQLKDTSRSSRTIFELPRETKINEGLLFTDLVALHD